MGPEQSVKKQSLSNVVGGGFEAFKRRHNKSFSAHFLLLLKANNSRLRSGKYSFKHLAQTY